MAESFFGQPATQRRSVPLRRHRNRTRGGRIAQALIPRCAFVVIVVVVSLLGGCSPDEGPLEDSLDTVAPDEQKPARQTSTTAAVPSPVGRVVDFYTALNRGEIEAMVANWPSGDPAFFSLLVDGVRERAFVVCSPGEVSSVVICEETVGNDFLDPAGIEGTYTMRYEVAEDLIVSADLIDAAQAVAEYERDFGAWLEENDPELFSASYGGTNGKHPFETAADAIAVISAVDSFIADSAVYPISADDPETEGSVDEGAAGSHEG